MSEEHCETSGKKETESGYILEIEPTGGRGEIPFTEMGGKNRRKIGHLHYSVRVRRLQAHLGREGLCGEHFCADSGGFPEVL